MKSLVLAAALLATCLASASPAHADVVTAWNARVLSCVQGPPNPPNRGGPTGLLDIALIQAAVHDAVQAIQGRFEPYHYADESRRNLGSTDAATAAASYRLLVALYGADDPCLAGVADPATTYPGDPGLQTGNAAAAALQPLYRPTLTMPPNTGGTAPGEWRPTPGFTEAANTFMAVTQPFVLREPRQFRPERQPPLTSQRYTREYEEVLLLGRATGSTRTGPQTELARFWSSNFVVQFFGLGRSVADARLSDGGDKARLLALLAFAMADSQIAVYETKYHYNFWRPITAIQLGDDDLNDRTQGDPTWTPFVQTPPYPDYTSGANNISGAATTILQLFFGTDDIPFTVSTTAAGVTINPRSYQRFSQAADEVVEARILQGIHFRSADEAGRRQGTRIGEWVFRNALRPLRSR